MLHINLPEARTFRVFFPQEFATALVWLLSLIELSFCFSMKFSIMLFPLKITLRSALIFHKTFRSKFTLIFPRYMEYFTANDHITQRNNHQLTFHFFCGHLVQMKTCQLERSKDRSVAKHSICSLNACSRFGGKKSIHNA